MVKVSYSDAMNSEEFVKEEQAFQRVSSRHSFRSVQTPFIKNIPLLAAKAHPIVKINEKNPKFPFGYRRDKQTSYATHVLNTVNIGLRLDEITLTRLFSNLFHDNPEEFVSLENALEGVSNSKRDEALGPLTAEMNFFNLLKNIPEGIRDSVQKRVLRLTPTLKSEIPKEYNDKKWEYDYDHKILIRSEKPLIDLDVFKTKVEDNGSVSRDLENLSKISLEGRLNRVIKQRIYYENCVKDNYFNDSLNPNYTLFLNDLYGIVDSFLEILERENISFDKEDIEAINLRKQKRILVQRQFPVYTQIVWPDETLVENYGTHKLIKNTKY